jgi:hypothetical protein
MVKTPSKFTNVNFYKKVFIFKATIWQFLEMSLLILKRQVASSHRLFGSDICKIVAHGNVSAPSTNNEKKLNHQTKIQTIELKTF